MNKVFETAGKSALTAAGALIGGGVGAALGTAIFPGPGTAVGYLFGVGYGTLSSLKAGKH
jgi:hypothetical protein